MKAGRCIDSEGQPPDPPSDQCFLPRIAKPQRDIGFAPCQVEHGIGYDHLDLDPRPFRPERRDMPRKNPDGQQVGRGDTDHPAWPLILPGDLQRQRRNLLLDAGDRIAHLFAGGRQGIAAGQPVKKSYTHPLLESADATKNG